MSRGAQRRPRLTARFLLGKVHLWIGLPLGVILGVIGLTGCLLMLEHPLQRMFDSSLYVASAPGTPHSIAEIAAAAREAAPAGSRVAAVVMPTDNGPAVVRFSPPRQGEPGRGRGERAGRDAGGRESSGREAGNRDGGSREAMRPGQPQDAGAQASAGGDRSHAGGPPASAAAPAGPPGAGGREVFLDPVTLKVHGTRATFSGPLGWIHQLHGNLLVPGRDGRSIVGWLGVLMVALALTGLYLWWPKSQWRNGRWKRAFLVTKGAGGWRLNRELHGSAGIWGFVVFVIVSATGVVLAFPGTSASVVSTVVETRDGRAALNALRVTPEPGAEAASLEEIAAIATAAAGNGASLRMLMAPQQPTQPARVMFIDPATEVSSTTVVVDPFARRVLQLTTRDTLSPGERALLWMRLLHEGEGLGTVWAVLVFVSGFLPALFTATGITMWLLKRRARRTRTDQPSARRPAAASVERTT